MVKDAEVTELELDLIHEKKLEKLSALVAQLAERRFRKQALHYCNA